MQKRRKEKELSQKLGKEAKKLIIITVNIGTGSNTGRRKAKLSQSSSSTQKPKNTYPRLPLPLFSHCPKKERTRKTLFSSNNKDLL
jgi:hypothetical protein